MANMSGGRVLSLLVKKRLPFPKITASSFLPLLEDTGTDNKTRDLKQLGIYDTSQKARILCSGDGELSFVGKNGYGFTLRQRFFSNATGVQGSMLVIERESFNGELGNQEGGCSSQPGSTPPTFGTLVQFCELDNTVGMTPLGKKASKKKGVNLICNDEGISNDSSEKPIISRKKKETKTMKYLQVEEKAADFREDQIKLPNGFSPSIPSSKSDVIVETAIDGGESITRCLPLCTSTERTFGVGLNELCSSEEESYAVDTDLFTPHGSGSSLAESNRIVISQVKLQRDLEIALERWSPERGGMPSAKAATSDTKRGDAACDGQFTQRQYSQGLKIESGVSVNSGQGKRIGIPAVGKEDGIEQSSPEMYQYLCNPSEIFNSLLASRQIVQLPESERIALLKTFKCFFDNSRTRNQALTHGIDSTFFPVAASHFQRFLLHKCTPVLRNHLLKLGPSGVGEQFLFSMFMEFCERIYSAETARHQALMQTSDLTKPHTWFPLARAMERKIVYHCGPTNSGKTYNALKRFKEASTGVYCAPLRLLAMEVYDRINADGVYCSLHTGQERKDVPFSNHLSCTVEMAPLDQIWEVAVVDEIQMINDEFRGWGWTRALLGLQAMEIHVCGDPSVLTLVRHICSITGDGLEENFYDRFKPLAVDTKSLQGNFQNIQPGDCIVTFSRKEIFGVKRAVERATRNRCCVVYGALPPETRTQQARLFNDPESGYDVLVASDAVGMGLNLNIRRVIFYTLHKFNGQEKLLISPSMVKQIAGRAGRRGSSFPNGVVTTFHSEDLPYLVSCMEKPHIEADSAGLFPTYIQIEQFASQLPGLTFTQLFDQFAATCRVDGCYFLCRNDNFKKIATVIDEVKGLSLEERFIFILAPVNTRDFKVSEALFWFAKAYGQKLPVQLPMSIPTGCVESDAQLLDLETRYQILSLYLWLSDRFPEEYFPQKEQAEEMVENVATLLGDSLALLHGRILRNKYIPNHVMHKSEGLDCWLEILKGSTRASGKPSLISEI